MMQDWLLSSRLRTSDGSIAREYIIVWSLLRLSFPTFTSFGASRSQPPSSHVSVSWERNPDRCLDHH
ncbi:hypothetical protein SISNIDRAFT_458836 [Sistotremastrum niveocremeum HHB9708]|uniref:Uncharacterized protein n=1 Tax=Sistotremastrum niveocremeum HHB9708 TaxID=1314777 RepID=A0A164Q5G0_9AGAM|nr:hypothetical protein SISNIDRAFT_458836 [Sistotremastrum niveocremeum HHB9708]